MGSDLSITNARIWTGDADRPWARAMHMERGRVAEIGDDATIQQESSNCPVIDAGGAFITPGLIDSHVHLLMGGEFLSRLDLSGVTSREEFEQCIAARHAELPPDAWLLAYGWSSENWSGEAPTRAWLRAAGSRPVVCYRMDLHAALVNEPVLRMCELSHEPEGGRIVRDASGEPTGVMIEAAAWNLINPLVPRPGAAAAREHLQLAQMHMHGLGVTAAGSMEYGRQVEDVFHPMRDALTLRCAITLLDRRWPLDLSWATPAVEKPWALADDHLRIIGCKAFIDGTLGSRTAYMLDAYADDPADCGLLVELAKDGYLHAWTRRVAQSGLSPSMHAIGDAAVRLALDAVEHVDWSVRPRIEHAQTIHPDDVPRFNGLFASMQPLHKADDGRYAAKRLGEDRMGRFFPFRRLLDAGAILAFGSDWPVVSADPLRGMQAAVTGLTLDGTPCGTDQNLTVDEALRAYTVDAARCLRLDHAGVLKPGAFGDCVIYDRDPFTVDWRNDRPRITHTIIGGRVVYDVQRESA